MNIVIVPLIGPNSDRWLPAGTVPLSCLDNFFRLFLAPPPFEVRSAATDPVIPEEIDASDLNEAPPADGRRYPNGFLVVDGGGALLIRIVRFVKQMLLAQGNDEQRTSEQRNLKYWLRILISRKPIPTVWRVESVSMVGADADAVSGAETARSLVDSLKGKCDAVIAFEGDASTYRLRAMDRSASPCTSLSRSCDLVLQQEALQETWHWDRDPDDHCRWLGIEPPDVTRRNRRMVGAALAFESDAILCDRYFATSLCQDVLHSRLRWVKDENHAYEDVWAPKWLESIGLMLDAWKTAAVDAGNGRSRKLVIWTAVDDREWNDLGWHFIARAERFLSNKLAGQVTVNICRSPSERRAYDEIHPRYLIASTRAIQIDRGFDVTLRTADTGLQHKYTEITSRVLHSARFVRERWTEKGMVLLPRIQDPPLTWTRSMTRWNATPYGGET